MTLHALVSPSVAPAAVAPSTPLLDVANLTLRLSGEAGPVDVVRGVSFTLGRERLAIVGESGSGKSMTMRALLGLAPPNARISADHARFASNGTTTDLLAPGNAGARALRGRRIAMVVQDPRQGLNPVRTIGSQIAEMIQLHQPLPRHALRDRVRELLDEVAIRDPARVAGLYPHEVSGGMGQRAMIAMMLAGEPDVLIADEATSALDMLVQQRILDLIAAQVGLRGMGLVLISHDLDLVSRYADRVAVMYGGRIVETFDTPGDLENAAHPYTRGLLACRPSLTTLGQRLPTLQRDPAWLN